MSGEPIWDTLTVISLSARVGLGEKWGAEALGWVGAIAGILGTVVAIVLAHLSSLGCLKSTSPGTLRV